jgi:hypothetical protein
MKKSVYTIFGLALFIRLIWAFMRWDFLQVAIYDDAFYYFSVAKHIMAGAGITADGITHTNGFHPLWLGLILPLFSSFIGAITSLRLTMVLAALLDVGAGLMIYKILKNLYDEKIGLIGASLYLFNPVVITQAMSGMETPLLALMVLLWVWVVLNDTASAFTTGIVAGLLCLARTDMVFVVLAGLIYALVANAPRRKIILLALPIILAVVTPWFLWNYLRFGSFVQESGSAYPFIFHDEWTYWFRHDYFSWITIVRLVDLTKTAFSVMASYFGGWPLLIIGLIIMAMSGWGDKKLRWLFIGSTAVIFIHVYIRWFPRIWYFHVPYIASILLIAPLIYKLKSTTKIVLAGLFMCGMLLVLSDATEDHVGSFRKAYLTQKRAITATKLMNYMRPGTIVGAWNSGYPSYFADSATVINLDGLANNSVVPYYKNRNFGAYCDSMKIEYIVDNPYFMDWSFGKYFERSYKDSLQLLIRVDSIALPENSMALYKLPNQPFFLFKGDKK